MIGYLNLTSFLNLAPIIGAANCRKTWNILEDNYCQKKVWESLNEFLWWKNVLSFVSFFCFVFMREWHKIWQRYYLRLIKIFRFQRKNIPMRVWGQKKIVKSLVKTIPTVRLAWSDKIKYSTKVRSSTKL